MTPPLATVAALAALSLAALPSAAAASAPNAPNAPPRCGTSAPQDRAPAGRWEGRIEGARLDVVVQLAWVEERLTGTIDIPAQGLERGALADVGFDAGTVRFRIDGVPGDPTFVGALDDAAGAIRGTFTQGGGELQFALARAVPTAALAAERLAGFEEWALDRAKRFRVPGLAVAVVWRGEVVLARGLGVADVDSGAPVTPDTLFAIGSTTKAFTTFAIAQAVEAGLLDWDARVRRWLPELDLVDDVAEQHLSLRDMCSHRSGLPRHDLVWYAHPDVPRAELITRLAHLAPTEPFRGVWQYNNLMFAAAGVALERATGATWEERVRAGILAPLGMQRTTFGSRELATRGDVASAHDRRRGKDVVIPTRDLTQIGPAGSIHSSANDMARWIGMLLARGSHAGGRLLSEGALAELATAVSVVHAPGAPTAYGLGWMLDDVEGHARVHHGGGIDGFTTQVELYPADRLGVFVVTNRASALTNLVAAELVDRFLELDRPDPSGFAASQADAAEGIAAGMQKAREAERVPDAPHARPLAAYAGEYRHGGYGALHVTLVDGTLRARYGTAEAALEHWHYEAFRFAEGDDAGVVEGLLVQFRDDLAGFVDAALVQLEPAAAPIRFERAPDAALADPLLHARLAGEYTLLGQTLRIERGPEGLSLLAPGQPAYALRPATHGRFRLDVADGYWARFEVDSEGPARAVVITQPNGVFRAERRAE